MAQERLKILPSSLTLSNTCQSTVDNLPSLPSPPILLTKLLSPGRKPLVLGDSAAFLTALAGQERRVLELREELKNAEMGLESLKQEWALHETSKKQSEIQQAENLQHINKSMHNARSTNSDEHIRVLKDQERRRATLVTTKHSQRKVFSGSRHTRTLSLLSPASANSQIMPIVVVVGAKSPQKTQKRSSVSNSLPPKSVLSTGTSKNQNILNSYSPNEIHRDAILETGKRLVGDLREGLWTFLEDLKQATVGDEATSPSVLRKSSPARFTHSAKNQTSNHNRGRSNKDSMNSKCAMLEHVGGHATESNSISTNQGHGYLSTSTETAPADNSLLAKQLASKQTSIQQPQRRNPTTSDLDDDGWDNWDSPKPKDLPIRWSTCSATSDSTASMPSLLTDQSSSRTSIR